MGFIFGIVNLDGKTVDSKEITSLAEAVGYPGFILQTEIEGAVAAGYCHRPDRNPKAGIYNDEELLVVADCRIYNGDELKTRFCFDSVEEAFAKAYKRWDRLCACHINGDFAAVVVDKKKKEVFLFRDHIGTRPLVYWKSDNQLIFASHEFGLAKSGLVPVALSERKVIDSYFRYKELYSETSFSGIHKVVPGCYVICPETGCCKSEQYWEPGEIRKDKTITFEAAVAGLRKRIIAATVNRMEPGRTGMHVSGGIDSCGVASIVADNTQDKTLLTGYSWTPWIFEDEVDGVDERPFIESFTADKKVNVKYVNLKENESVEDSFIPEFETQHIELPVMKMAEADGIETLFSGWGGDEFVSLSLRGTLNHLFFSFKWGTLLKYAKAKGIKTVILKSRTDILPFLIPFGLMHVYKAGKTDWSILKLLEFSFVKRHWKQIFCHRNKNIFGYGNRTKFALNLLNLHHIPERMDSWAINAERYGFDYKYPLLDKDVLEFWFSLPVEYTYWNFQSRLLYREAMKGILTEKIRIRNEKGEALRIASSLKSIDEGRGFVKNIFGSLTPEDHLPFFKPESFGKILDMPFSKKNLLKSISNWQKEMSYLRYVMLVRKYMKNNCTSE
ncbi:MAG: asparagine synthase-related protein [Bacteroidales bacterium]|jgi:asparagine synthase (glutamine-hydrolysing)|nr:asparagine synthase-related protein [Bacteroidales bacterium]MCI1784903.1 asparagine synthase-related protein [Bacteroidales bacterium]